MTDILPTTSAGDRPQHARDLQSKLYREIGISAVAAALRSINQPDPTERARGVAKPSEAPRDGLTRAA